MNNSPSDSSPLDEPGSSDSTPTNELESSSDVGALRWEGDEAELFKIYIKQILLSIVTLGIYYFWGKTQVRQYLWGHVRWEGDRFRYAGSGWELFAGFLKALVGYAIMFGLYFLVNSAGNRYPSVAPVINATSVVIFGGLFFGLYSYALYTARRYLLSRTEWRGIRFFQEGSGFTFARIRIVHGLLNVLTLGLYYSWYRYRQLDYVVNHTTFGEEQFAFNGDPWTLFRGALFYIGLCAVLPGAVLISLTALLFAVFPPLGVIPAMLAGLFVPLAFLTVGFYYRAFEQRHVAENTTYRGLGFHMDHSGWEYFRLKFFNGLLISISGGLLTPLAIKRSAEFLEKHLEIEGTVDFETIRQQAERGPRHDTGEGLTELFTRSVTLMGFFKL